MKWTPEEKIELVKYYLTTHQMPVWEGTTKKKMAKHIYDWARLYEYFGERAFYSRKTKWTFTERKFAVTMVLENGYSCAQVALKLGMERHETISKWVQKYLSEGDNGLKSKAEGKITKKPKEMKKKDYSKCTREELEKQLQLRDAEIEYLKKLRVLIHKKKVR